MEKSLNPKSFEKKIVPYLDGSLSQEEAAEFEAFVHTNPEFQTKIKSKQDEIQHLKELIPAAILSSETRESLQTEMRASIFNLLKEEPKNLIDIFRIKWEEFRNR